MKKIIFGLGLFVLLLSVLSSGCTSQNEVITDEVISVPDNDQHLYLLSAGTYKITLTSDTDIDVLFDTVADYDQKGKKTFDKVVTLTEDTTMTVKNWALIGLGSDANVQVKIIKNPVV
ncbi:hypothetical protein L1994_06415 [Methanomicrobium antiquum]|uniref:Uncharacterized protein n=1 Tax=Methanomicrobium antiquum TaxID=487686 RepID=A0AAF0FTT6_9EURY|nr:hypothetical protein [Methanomicrobium antiquum]MDD3976954.1 hypothetical protein [Methanomicrobium sp.]WFN35795.1 hypothetical protein L1994_06415 [Methanomicrobium antiquum]